jgi:hypothetical protein
VIGARRWCLAGALAVALFTAPARAQTPPAPAPTPADSTFEDFFEELADSTSRYFGVAGAPVDTTGLDSLLAHRLATTSPPREKFKRSIHPDFNFNRVDGPTYELTAVLGTIRTIGQLRTTGGYAAGPDDWLWGAKYSKTFGPRWTPWRFDIEHRKHTLDMDRERSARRLTALRAFVTGQDSHHYLRQEGLDVTLSQEYGKGVVEIGYRDDWETPLVTTTGWNLLKNELKIFDNLPAARGRAREFRIGSSLELEPLPLVLEAMHQTSGHALGSDFEYRRTRLALSGNIGVGSIGALIPQVVYGRLSGLMTPQNAFYLGGSRTLRSMPSSSRAGESIALARVELMGTRDILEVLRIPHPAFLPIQLGTFVGGGAVWGDDPFGGTRDGVDWPDREHWVSEAGFSLVFQPGIPDPLSVLRLSFAWALGPEREEDRFAISFTRALDLLRTR